MYSQGYTTKQLRRQQYLVGSGVRIAVYSVVHCEMAVEVAMEDDVFFADLNRQISLLIDDDDDDPLSHFPSVSPQIFSLSTIHPSMLAPPQYLYQENCTREYLINRKGTGVFIPQRPQLKRKYREQRKRANFNNNDNNSNKQFTNSNGRSNGAP
ncbi:hypothetical protein Cgig2_011007 [Carnegiea gigantea]|uniref:Uncharacterized protein n=1 Tax=Carnegiea gigantea TaxID=171969 RepID=A0A9Q1QHU1_9CARY|nr:hypothetical protein Cgig2_011007 [Carnegiea gigantea]